MIATTMRTRTKKTKSHNDIMHLIEQWSKRDVLFKVENPLYANNLHPCLRIMDLNAIKRLQSELNFV